MSDEDFEFLRKLAYDYTGIVLADHKKDMVYSRLARRMRALNLRQFSDYCELLKSGNQFEQNEFINAITTNLTSFFRESHHFEYLKSTVLPYILKTNASNKRLRIWSSACSTGEEPYSIAMTLKEANFPATWDARILATDLDSNVIEKGAGGVYSWDRVEGLDKKRIAKFFHKEKSEAQPKVKLKPMVCDYIAFKRLNLLEAWPMKGMFDVIFCRNVVIYFNKETQRVLFDRMADLLPVGGHLFIGHSENLTNVTTRFESVGRTIYRKLH